MDGVTCGELRSSVLWARVYARRTYYSMALSKYEYFASFQNTILGLRIINK